MGKTLTDEDIKLNIIINGNTAQKELQGLEKATRKLTEENKSYLQQKKLLEKQGKQETEEYKNLIAVIKDNTKAIAANKIKMGELQKEIGITGLTMKQLSDRANFLKISLRNAVPGGSAFQEYTAELKQVTARMNELSGKAKVTRFSISSIADGFNKYQGLALSFIATLTGVFFSIQKIIDINGKLSDAQADVMKTTGMNKKEVDDLTKSFGALETRTSRMDLLGIAEQGGRIGIMKEEIGSFVDVMNKASVSLGDSFTGGAEEVANKLGKIKFLFQETKDIGVDKAYNAIGSAINDLGANGVASEANIAEFTTRIGSLTDVLKPTIQETLALGTAFEESGIEAEVSARAYNIFMKQASTESAKFAKVMGISQKSVEDMINTNPLDFMMKFAEGMRGMDATKTAKTLDYLGVNADGANKVIGAMGNNINRFRELIDLSNESFGKGTSLINEYNIKNETLGATLEKISKKISGFFSSEGFINWLGGAVMWISKFIGATEDADGSVGKWKNTLVFTIKILAVLATALFTNVGWQKLVAMWTTRNTEATILYNIAEKTRAFLTGLSTIATEAQSLAVAIATRNTVAAKEATIALGAAMKTTPWGFILSALAAVVVAYQMFSEKVSTAAAAQQVLADVHAEAAQSISKEKSELDQLTKISQDKTLEYGTRMAAIEKLNEMIPDHIGILTLENIANQEGADILKAYTEEIYKNARARAVQANYDKLVSEKVAAENKGLSEYRSGTGNFFNGKVDPNLKSDEDIKKYATEFTKGLKDRNGNLMKEGTAIFTQYRDMTYNNMKAKLQGLLNDKNNELAVIDAKIKALEPEITKNTVASLNPKEGDTKVENGVTFKFSGGKWVKVKSTFDAPDGVGDGKKDPNSSAADIAKLRYENEAKYGAMSLKLQRQLEDERLAAMEEGYQKELELENTRYVRQMQDLESQKVHKDEMVKMDADIDKAKADGDMTKYNALLQIKEGWKEKNKVLDAQINNLELSEIALHNKKVGIIEEKAATESLKKAQENFRREQNIKKTQFLEELNAVTSLEQAKDMLKGKISDNEINRITTLEEAKAALQTQYNKEEEQREIDFLNDTLEKLNQIINTNEFEGIDLTLMTPKQKENFLKMVEELKLKIAELKKAMNGETEDTTKKGAADSEALSNKVFGEGDIFGYTAKDWETAFGNLETTKQKMTAIIMVVDALRNAWGIYDQAMTAKENAQLKKYEQNINIKKARLKNQLDTGIINQNQYNKAVEVVDKELDRKKLEIEYKQAKRKRAMGLADVAINTAKGVMAVMSTGGGTEFADFGVSAAILSALVIATGAVQASMIMKEPLPSKGYEDGLYPEYVKRQQDGKVFKPSYHGKMKTGMYSKPTFLVGEGPGDMPEMIIDKRAYAGLSDEAKDMLTRELSGVPGFEKGYYNQKKKRFEVPADSGSGSSQRSSDSELLEMAIQVISRNNDLLQDLRDNPLIAVVRGNDWKSLNEVKEGLKTLDKINKESIKS